LSDLDADSVQRAIQRLFDASKNLEDSAFQDFVNALCKLSSEMVGMQSDVGPPAMLLGDMGSSEELASPTSLSPATAHRRRVSGIHLPRTLVSNSFHSVSRSCTHLFLFSDRVTSVLTSSEGWHSSTSTV
jgi:hypothetical protein